MQLSTIKIELIIEGFSGCSKLGNFTVYLELSTAKRKEIEALIIKIMGIAYMPEDLTGKFYKEDIDLQLA